MLNAASLVCAAGANQGDIESNARTRNPPPEMRRPDSTRPGRRDGQVAVYNNEDELAAPCHCYRHRYLLLVLPPPAGSSKTWERKDIPASPSHPGDICCGIPPSQASLGPISRFQSSSPSRAFTCHRVDQRATYHVVL